MSLNYFALDADSAVNSSSYNYVAYSFSSVPGYSAIGKYKANSSADGPAITLDFRPRFMSELNLLMEEKFVTEDKAYSKRHIRK